MKRMRIESFAEFVGLAWSLYLVPVPFAAVMVELSPQALRSRITRGTLMVYWYQGSQLVSLVELEKTQGLALSIGQLDRRGRFSNLLTSTSPCVHATGKQNVGSEPKRQRRAA